MHADLPHRRGQIAKPNHTQNVTTKIIFWNINGLKNLFRISTDEKIHLQKSAIIGLAETWYHKKDKPSPHFLKHMSSYHVPAVKIKSKGRARGGLMLFVNPEIVKQTQLIESNDTWITIKFKINNQEFYVLNIYMRAENYLDELTRLSNAIQRIQDVQDCGILLIGDMNARIGVKNQLDEEVLSHPSLSAHRESVDKCCNKNGSALLDALEPLGFFALNGRAPSDSKGEFTFVAAPGASTIDMTWVNHAAADLIQDFNVSSMGTSDHLPIFLHLAGSQLEKDTNPRRSRLYRPRWNIDKSREFVSTMEREQCGWTTSTEDMDRTLTSSIKLAAEGACLLPKEKTPTQISTQPWFNKACASTKRDLNHAIKLWHKTRENDCKQEYIKTRNKHVQAVKKSKREYIEKMQDAIAMAKNPADFWKAVNRYRRRKYTACPITIAEWTNFYKQIFSNPPNKQDIYQGCAHPVLDAEITMSEVKAVIKRLKNNKTPGPNSLSNEFYKALPIKWLWHITRLYNKALTTNIIPAEWTKSELIMIHKKGDVLDPGNYRGIALTNSIAKIFTSILARRISDWCEQAGIFPESQAGFRRDRGCEDDVFVLQAKVTAALSRPKGKLFVAFVDLKRAFDSINHGILWHKLYLAGISPQLIRTLQNFYQKACFRIKLGPGEESEYIGITEGVFQGDPLSPLLFLLVLTHTHTLRAFSNNMGNRT